MTFDELEAMSSRSEEKIEASVPSKPAYNNNNYNNNYNKDKPKINMYEVDFITSKKIDTDTFEKSGRSFAVHVYEGSEDIEKKILFVATKLVEEGFVFRHNGASDNKLQNKILEIDNIKVESYLPYPKFNENIKKATISNFFELPFKYAAELYGQRYNELKKGARAIYASQLQSLLGKECNNPVDFLLCYSPDGSERHPVYEKGKKIDYTKLGTLGFYLKVTDASGIATYNFKNDSSITSLIKLIK